MKTYLRSLGRFFKKSNLLPNKRTIVQIYVSDNKKVQFSMKCEHFFAKHVAASFRSGKGRSCGIRPVRLEKSSFLNQSWLGEG